MIAFIVIVAIVIGALFEPVVSAFMANPALNGLIVGVLILGIVYMFRHVVILYPEVSWIETYRRGEPGLSIQRAPVLLAPIATMLQESQGRVSLSAMSMRYMLDSISSRLDESREISRYLIGLLIFLGLLGTFWGLLETISSVGGAIGSLALQSSDFISQFDSLKKGLEAPLKGMGTAFSSSLFGLAGSLVLGFLDLQAAQAQRGFYNDLEEWLSSLTRLTSGRGLGDEEQSVPAYVNALLERTADSLDDLQRTLARTEENRNQQNASTLEFADRLATLADQMRTEQDLMVKLVETQMEIRPVLQRLADAGDRNEGGFDQASRTHLRNLDVSVRRFIEEASQDRADLVQDIRGEIKLLVRTIAAIESKR
jgi:hypothetical protein